MRNSLKQVFLAILITLSGCGGQSSSTTTNLMPATLQMSGVDLSGVAWSAEYSSVNNSLEIGVLDLQANKVIDTQRYNLKSIAGSAKLFEIEQLPGFIFGMNSTSDSAIAAVKSLNLNGGTSVVPIVLNSSILSSLDAIKGSYVFRLPGKDVFASSSGAPDNVVTFPGYNFDISADGSVKYMCVAQNASDQQICDQLKLTDGRIAPLSRSGWWQLSFNVIDSNLIGASPVLLSAVQISTSKSVRYMQLGGLYSQCNGRQSCLSYIGTALDANAIPGALNWAGKWLVSRESLGSAMVTVQQAPNFSVAQISGPYARELPVTTSSDLSRWSLALLDANTQKVLGKSELRHNGLFFTEFSGYSQSALFAESLIGLPQDVVRVPANGTSGPYLLYSGLKSVVPKTVQVRLLTIDPTSQAVLSSVSLQEFNDFSVDSSGWLIFRSPVPSLDPQGNQIVIEYSANSVPSNTSAFPMTMGIRID